MLRHILIRPRTLIHVGEGSLTSAKPTIPSSTITSALISSMIELGVLDEKDLSRARRGEPIIRASSLLPVAGGRIYVWVRGLNILLRNQLEELKKKSDALTYSRVYAVLSDIRLCDWMFLKRIIDGETPLLRTRHGDKGINVETLIDDREYYVADTGAGGKALVEENAEAPVFHRATLAKNIVDRVTSSTDIYYIAGVSSGNDMLLYIDVPKDLLEGIEAALRLLKDKGLGGKKSAGYGRFTILGNGGAEADELARYMVKEGSHGIMQGVYTPAPGEEEVLRESYYRVRIHRGRGGLTGIVLSKVMYTSEGSVISLRKARVVGGFAQPCIGRVVVDSVGGDTVIRHYTPIYIPIKLGSIGG